MFFIIGMYAEYYYLFKRFKSNEINNVFVKIFYLKGTK